jgi:hypothetical protein
MVIRTTIIQDLEFANMIMDEASLPEEPAIRRHREDIRTKAASK